MLKMFRSKRAVDLVLMRLGEALREIGILWLVFSVLDKLLTAQLTFAWSATNAVVTVVLWFTGTYIELRQDEGAA